MLQMSLPVPDQSVIKPVNVRFNTKKQMHFSFGKTSYKT